MMMWFSDERRSLVVLLAVVALLSGCRTYGDYGTEEATMAEIVAANEEFGQALERAEAEGAELARAAATNPVLAVPAALYSQVLDMHRVLLAAHLLEAEELADGFSLFATINQIPYRQLNRTYGAIISEQHAIRDRYQEVYTLVGGVVGRPLPGSVVGDASGRYYVVPPQYKDIREYPQPSMRYLLGG